MLRPSHATMLADVKEITKRSKTKTSMSNDCFDVCNDDDDDDDGLSPELRAEQLLLLALHPQSPSNPLPPVPDQSSSNWAEPGWQLVLESSDSDKKGTSFSSILPCQTFEGQLSQKFLSGCCSSGRQAASLIKPRHLRMLSAPLSFTGQASAPAETNPSGDVKSTQGTECRSIHFSSSCTLSVLTSILEIMPKRRQRYGRFWPSFCYRWKDVSWL